MGVYVEHVKASRLGPCSSVRCSLTVEEDTEARSSEKDKMKDVNIMRNLVIILCAVVFVAVLVFNALAGAGKGR